MITGQLKSDIDRLWEHRTGGIANPLSVIEQISYLMFLRMLDIRESRDEKRAKRLGGKAQEAFERTRVYTSDTQNLRWHHWRHEEPAQMLETVGGPVFAHLRRLGGAGTFGEYSRCPLMIPAGELLPSREHGGVASAHGSDTKGDLYEYPLGKLTAGINGRSTPRHIIEMMVRLMDPQPDETVCDPRTGYCGDQEVHRQDAHLQRGASRTPTQRPARNTSSTPAITWAPRRPHSDRDVLGL